MTTPPEDSRVQLTESALLELAEQETGLRNFGEEDFRTGLRILLESAQREANLSVIGKQTLQQDCLRWLTNRLKIEDNLTRYPEILTTPLRRPLFIVCLPRTGSTLLHRLLSQDEQARAPLFWELWRPAPPPRTETRLSDPRIAQLEEEHVRSIQRLFPDVLSMHAVEASAPEECFFLLQNSFVSYSTSFFYDIPSYQEWVRTLDLVPSYRYYKKQLQLLSWQCFGEPWILKNPEHLLSLEAILQVFPDAAIVQVHRDPKVAVASLCSLQHSVLNLWRESPLPPESIGERILHKWQFPVTRSMQVRAQANERQFYDLDYSDLVTDPIGSIRRLYGYFGYELTTGSVSRMQSWLTNNPQHKHGKHDYTLETYGVTPDQVDDAFADYVKAFGFQGQQGRKRS